LKILVIDIGGSNVKLHIGNGGRRKFRSGPQFTPRQFASEVRTAAEGWEFDVVSIGFPAPVIDGKPVSDPVHLGQGWKRFDFEKALGKPVRVINDAALQALGSYEGGRMLFLGLGTGLGSALVVEGVVVPLELSELPYSRRWTLEEMLGKSALKRIGARHWQKVVNSIVKMLRAAFLADYVVLGGGNVKKLQELPAGVRRGNNDNAYQGGVRLWQDAPIPSQQRPSRERTLL
jgi:polyphosphate glucokinase